MFCLPSNEHNNNKIMRFSYEIIICHAKISKPFSIYLETSDHKKGQKHAFGKFNLITTINKMRKCRLQNSNRIEYVIQYRSELISVWKNHEMCLTEQHFALIKSVDLILVFLFRLEIPLLNRELSMWIIFASRLLIISFRLFFGTKQMLSFNYFSHSQKICG